MLASLLQRVGTPSYGESWIHHCRNCSFVVTSLPPANEVMGRYIYVFRCLSVHSGGRKLPPPPPGRQTFPLEGIWNQTGSDIIHPGNHQSGRYASYWNAFLLSGFPLFRIDKIPWYFHDFSRFLSKFPGIFFIIFKVWFISGFEYK